MPALAVVAQVGQTVASSSFQPDSATSFVTFGKGPEPQSPTLQWEQSGRSSNASGQKDLLCFSLLLASKSLTLSPRLVCNGVSSLQLLPPGFKSFQDEASGLTHMADELLLADGGGLSSLKHGPPQTTHDVVPGFPQNE
ncbi:hypothetical protein AAY473_036524 [Plecturocebus cupreus]